MRKKPQVRAYFACSAYRVFLTGGQEVAGSNPASPTRENPRSYLGFVGCLASTANENGYCERTRLWAISASWPPTACLWRSNIQAGVCGASLATAQARFFSLLVSRVVPTGTFRVTGEQGVKKTGLGIVPNRPGFHLPTYSSYRLSRVS